MNVYVDLANSIWYICDTGLNVLKTKQVTTLTTQIFPNLSAAAMVS